MPHRDPLIAALARCEQLRQRIAEFDGKVVTNPGASRSMSDAIQEEERLLRCLERLERLEEASRESAGDELAGVAVAEAPVARELPIHPEPSLRPRVALVVGLLVAVSAAIPFALDSADRAAASQRPLDLALTAVVVDTKGAIAAKEGDRCTLEFRLFVHGTCTANVSCPGVVKSSSSRDCLHDVVGPLQAHLPGVDLDGTTVRFVESDEAGTRHGSATLLFDSGQ